MMGVGAVSSPGGRGWPLRARRCAVRL